MIAFMKIYRKLIWYYQDYKPEYDFAKTHVADGNILCSKLDAVMWPSQGFAENHYRELEFNMTALEKASASELDGVIVPLHKEATEQGGFNDVVCHFQVLEACFRTI